MYYATRIVFCLFFFIISFKSFSQTDITKSPKIGKVVFFDDFLGNKIDRTKWNVEVTGNHFNDELQAYVDSNNTISLSEGNLVFQPRYTPGFVTKDGQKFNFTSTRLNTKDKFDFLYGTAEARIKITDGQGLWPAWWLLGYGSWPHTGEIDIMEYVGEKDWASAAVHGSGYSGETPFVNRLYFDANNDITHWHTYAVEWSPEMLLFKYDGKIMFKVTKAMTAHYGKWVLDSKEYLILNFAVGGIYPKKINGVTKPNYGLPEKTFELIKNGKAKMYVDWVKVTQY
jgi:beta-glucanase (GH16 family)